MSDQLNFDFNLAPGKDKPKRTAAKSVVAKANLGDRGKKAEAEVAKAFKKWADAEQHREANRLLDARAAGRVVKSAPADFEFFQGPTRARTGSCHGLIEVKETRHEFRLAVDKVKQLPRLVHRSRCGGLCGVLVYHSTRKLWRAIHAESLHAMREGASWDLSGWPTYTTAQAALQDLFPLVFTFGDAP